MKAKEILGMVGVYVLVGAASTAGAALWTNVLQDKFVEAKDRITKPKNNVIDFRKAKKMMGR